MLVLMRRLYDNACGYRGNIFANQSLSAALAGCQRAYAHYRAGNAELRCPDHYVWKGQSDAGIGRVNQLPDFERIEAAFQMNTLVIV